MIRRTDVILAHAAALAAAALVPATIGGLMLGAPSFGVLGALLGFASAIILGLPVYLILRSLRWATLWTSAAAGALIAAAPILWPVLAVTPDQAWVGDVSTVVDGRRTLAGWTQTAQLLGLTAVVGACSGGAFWLVLRWTGAASPPAAGAPEVSGRRSRIAAGAMAAVLAGVAALPTITADRSCHEVIPPGARGIVPILSLRLDVTEADWPRLSEVMKQFAAEQGLDFRAQSRTEPGVFSALSLSACRPGLVVSVEKQDWRGLRMDELHPGVSVHLFQVTQEAPWRPTATALIDRLEQVWPGRVGYTAGSGKMIGRAEAMQGRPNAGPEY